MNTKDAESGSFHLVGLTSDICEDNFEEGEGASTGCGLRLAIGKTFATFPDMLKYLAGTYGLSASKNDYNDEGNGTLETSRAVANHSNAQNGGWFEPTEEEYAQWRAGKLKLYVENFDIKWHNIA